MTVFELCEEYVIALQRMKSAENKKEFIGALEKVMVLRFEIKYKMKEKIESDMRSIK